MVLGPGLFKVDSMLINGTKIIVFFIPPTKCPLFLKKIKHPKVDKK
jgi:hypothetical protein